MVGDSISDMEAGKNLGMETMLVLTGEGQKTLKNFVIKIHNIFCRKYIRGV